MKALFGFLITFVFFSNSFAQCNQSMPYWLVGTWEIQNTIGSSFEEWKNSGDTVLIGRTYSFYDKDTLNLDQMMIKCIDGKPIYFMYASMGSKRVFAGYKLSADSNNIVWHFENEVTDFPRAFTYLRISDNQTYVWFESANVNDMCTDFMLIRTKP